MNLICFIIFARNEQQRIARCIASVRQQTVPAPIYVIVNGSTDNTAHIARSIDSTITVVEYATGGKSRAWNQFILDTLNPLPQICIIMDGDCYIDASTTEGIIEALQAQPHAHAAAVVSLQERHAARDRAIQVAEHIFWGGCYALRGSFIAQMRKQNIYLPDDLIGDDGLLNAFVKTDLTNDKAWNNQRVAVSKKGGFYADEINILRLEDWYLQYKRVINYTVRTYQNQIISHYMQTASAKHIPRHLSQVYAQFLPQFKIRGGFKGWFDWRALRRIRRAMRGSQKKRS